MTRLAALLGSLVLAVGISGIAGATADEPAGTRVHIGSAQCHGDLCFLTVNFRSPTPTRAVIKARGTTRRLKIAAGRSTRVVPLPRHSLSGHVRVRVGSVEKVSEVRIADLPVNSSGSPCATVDPTQAYLSVGPTSAFDAQSSVPSTGTLRAAVIFADFPDLVGSGDPKPVHLPWLAEGISATRTSSYGRLDVSVTGVTPGWVRLPKSTSEYGITDSLSYDQHRVYLQDAINAADASIDFSDIDVVLVFVPPGNALPRSHTFRGQPGSLSSAEGPLQAGITFGSDATAIDGLTFSHELNHTMGLPDLYDLTGSDTHRFVGTWDYMGSIFTPHTDLTAWQRLKLGWLAPDQMLCARPHGTTAARLSPLASSRGVKAVFVRTGPTTGVVVENRQPLRGDASICRAGALVYTLDSAVASGDGPIRVQGDTQSDCGAGRFSNAPLGLGQHLRVNGLRISVVGTPGHAIEVQVRH